MFHVILFEPEIPPNTGNVIRLCANTGAALHLIKPLGFRLDARALRRAGLDYAELATVRVHDSLDACLEQVGNRVFAIETGGERPYAEARFGAGDALLFGPETRGLPHAVLERLQRSQVLHIPMRAGNRSLNLSNSVALVLYEAWRQIGFPVPATELSATSRARDESRAP
jgi:tRNA (cytidine/uridine-2'-O-)-methyltransferase